MSVTILSLIVISARAMMSMSVAIAGSVCGMVAPVVMVVTVFTVAFLSWVACVSFSLNLLSCKRLLELVKAVHSAKNEDKLVVFHGYRWQISKSLLHKLLIDLAVWE